MEKNMPYTNNREKILQIIQQFEEMKKKIVIALKKDYIDLDVTNNQLRIIEYMLKGKNWMKTKTQLCKELGCSRPTLLLCEGILKDYYEEKYKE